MSIGGTLVWHRCICIGRSSASLPLLVKALQTAAWLSAAVQRTAQSAIGSRVRYNDAGGPVQPRIHDRTIHAIKDHHLCCAYRDNCGPNHYCVRATSCLRNCTLATLCRTVWNPWIPREFHNNFSGNSKITIEIFRNSRFNCQTWDHAWCHIKVGECELSNVPWAVVFEIVPNNPCWPVWNAWISHKFHKNFFEK